MISDLAAYGLLASIFIVNGLRMFLEKPTRVAQRPMRLFERFRRNSRAKTASVDS